MNPKILAVALIAALGSGCASTDKNRAAYQIVPVSAVTHGAAGAPSYYQLARYYHGQKRFDLAEAAYMKSIAMDSSQIATRNALGSLYAERGDLVRSVQEFEKALAIVPDAGYLYNNLGFAYFLQGRLYEAYDAIRKALEFDPTLERGWANLERIAVAQSDSRLAAVAKSRRVHALPATLLASSPADATLSSVESPPTKRDEIATTVVATSPALALPLVSATESQSDSGRFVLVSTRREVVNLAEPVTEARLESVVVAQSEPFPIATIDPVDVIKAKPIVTEKTEPFVAAQAEPLAEPVSIAKTESSVPVPEPSVRDADIDLSRINVEVTNANGIGGFAKKFSAQLRQEHVPVRRITNYASFLLKETVIEYQPGYLDAARALMRRTQLDVRLTPAKGPRVNSDVRIVLGRDALTAGKQLLAKAP